MCVRSNLPGSIGVALEEGKLPPQTPGLEALASKLRAGPEGFIVVDGRIEEARWPLRNDVVLAHCAAKVFPVLPERLGGLIDTVEAWLGGRALSVDDLKKNWHVAEAIHWGSMFAKEPRNKLEELFLTTHPGASADVLAELERALEAPFDNIKTVELTSLLTSAAYNASEGWLAYHAHRRYASPVAVSAARAMAIAAEAYGPGIWERLVDEALRLPVGE